MKKAFVRAVIIGSIALNTGLVYLLHDATQTGVDAFEELHEVNESNKSLVKDKEKLQAEIKELKEELAKPA